MFARVQEKENQLRMASEIGGQLVEKNEDLSRQLLAHRETAAAAAEQASRTKKKMRRQERELRALQHTVEEHKLQVRDQGEELEEWKKRVQTLKAQADSHAQIKESEEEKGKAAVLLEEKVMRQKKEIEAIKKQKRSIERKLEEATFDVSSLQKEVKDLRPLRKTVERSGVGPPAPRTVLPPLFPLLGSPCLVVLFLL